MKSWPEIYKEEINNYGGPRNFVLRKTKEKGALISRITKVASKDGLILEAGCGTGANSSYLASLGYNVWAIDSDKAMLKLAKKISKQFAKKPNFECGDTKKISFSKDYFDVVFSHGVLEHFSDEDIIKIINEQLRVGKYVIFSVPSDYYSDDDRMYGDERFMCVDKWHRIIRRTNGELIESFGFYFQNWFYRFINKISSKILIKKAPYIGFIIKKN